MSQKTERLWSTIHKIIMPLILNYLQTNDIFWIVSINKIIVSKDNSFADIYLESQKNIEKLPKFLSKYAKELRSVVCKNISIYKVPKFRFKITQNNDELYSLITQLSKQYDLN